ncbi:flippase-like domain-containing protein [Patescibacteria group bacterium]|nr:MAG: flippase-like domain-containing protein [Patescibacteria group bacterium]
MARSDTNEYTGRSMKFRQIFFLAVVVLLIVLLLRNTGHLHELVQLLKQVNLFVLALIIPVRYAYYWSNTRFYQHFYTIYGKKLSFRELFPAVMSMNFINTVIPSGGVSGLTYFTKAFERRVTHRQALLAQAFWYIAVLVSMVFVLALSFLILLATNAVLPVSSRFILVLSLILLIGGIMLFALTLNDQILVKALYVLTRPANWILRLLKRPPLTEKHIERFVGGYHDLIELFREQPKRAVRPFLDALLTIGVELLSLTIIFLAFGKVVNVGAVGVAYILAMLFSIASIFTNGVGAYEAAMVGVFTALGYPLELSISVTALYRLIAMWLFIPFGLYFYRHRVEREIEEEEA